MVNEHGGRVNNPPQINNLPHIGTHLHFVGAQVLVVQALEPAARFFGADLVRSGGGGFGAFQDGLFDVDGAIQAQGQSQRVAGPGIHGDQIAIFVEPDHGVEGVVFQFAYDNFTNASAQAVQQDLDQVMSHRPGSRYFFDLQSDGIGLVDPNPDGQDGIPAEILQNHNGHVRDRIHHQAADFHFYFHVVPPNLLNAGNRFARQRIRSRPRDAHLEVAARKRFGSLRPRETRMHKVERPIL